LIDLSHTVEDGIMTYTGLLAPMVCDDLSSDDAHEHSAEGTEFVTSRVGLAGNTGTYLDAPRHRDRAGCDVSELALSVVAALDSVLVRLVERNARALTPDLFTRVDLRGQAVLIQIGWDRHWRTDHYLEGHSFLTGDNAELRTRAGARLDGIYPHKTSTTARARCT